MDERRLGVHGAGAGFPGDPERASNPSADVVPDRVGQVGEQPQGGGGQALAQAAGPVERLGEARVSLVGRAGSRGRLHGSSFARAALVPRTTWPVAGARPQ